jgi:chorismate mutase
MVDEDYIKKIRQHIDRIDMVLITAMAERLSLMPEIAQYKKEKEIPIFDEVREVQIMDRLKKVAKENGLEEGFVEEIFLSVFNEAKRIQKEFMDKE